MPALRTEQFKGLAGRLSEPDGGFSIHTETGHEPSTGYMVSQAGTEQAHHGDVTSQHLMQYAGTHANTLREPDAYMGGWHNPKTGEKDLDVSHRFVDHGEAHKEMFRQDQDALYDLDKGRSETNHLKHGFPGHPVNQGAYRATQTSLPEGRIQ